MNTTTKKLKKNKNEKKIENANIDVIKAFSKSKQEICVKKKKTGKQNNYIYSMEAYE